MKTLPPVPMTYGEWKALLLKRHQKPICSESYIPDDTAGFYMEVSGFNEGFWYQPENITLPPRYKGGSAERFLKRSDAYTHKFIEKISKPYITREDYDLDPLQLSSYIKDRVMTTSTAPKVTIEDVEASIKDETYTVLPDGRTTICQLTMDNGFTVDGHSACVSAANFNTELGNKYSREEAIKKVWAYLGFRLADRLHVLEQAEHRGILGEDSLYVGTKAVKALPMTLGEYNDYRGWSIPENEDGTDPGYLVEYLDGGEANHDKHKGYISWSPQAVFDKSYKKVS